MAASFMSSKPAVRSGAAGDGTDRAPAPSVMARTVWTAAKTWVVRDVA